MALRRSSRLSAVLLQPTAQAQAPQPNGITKSRSRKPSTKEKQKKTQTIKNITSHPEAITDPNPTKIAPPLDPKPSVKPNNGVDSSTATSNNPSLNYWETAKPTPNTNRQSTPPAPPLNRPVEPHLTNATLLTPHGSSLTAYPSDISPSKTNPNLPRPTATTGTLLEKATAHLIATDARLEPLIRAHPCALFSPEGLAEKVDPFRSLVGTIIGQQVSGAAARSIRDKFVGLLFGLSHPTPTSAEMQKAAEEDYFPTPEEIIRVDIPTLRTAGLSQRKAEYIQGLSEKFASGELSARILLNASDEELLEKLTSVRGLGRWSVEMFACFTLKRTDVFSTGDLGVQRGCAAFIGKDVSRLKAKGGKFKYMSENDMLELAAKFAPYRSLFMWYMWRVEEVDVTVMGG
ncbi:DNA-3-methyladenine glycosylase II [Aspergillus undulatus]|uniref:DNA-3-methyladenine glycosylase II n=1 Tax=Aspergillus undulatus TaxID=1810928 RepID=UPI003CCD4CC9